MKLSRCVASDKCLYNLPPEMGRKYQDASTCHLLQMRLRINLRLTYLINFINR